MKRYLRVIIYSFAVCTLLGLIENSFSVDIDIMWFACLGLVIGLFVTKIDKFLGFKDN